MIEKIGTKFPRYRLMFQGRHWTGKEWVAEPAKALLFTSETAAEAELIRIDPENSLPLKGWTFTVPVEIEFISHWPIPFEQLQRHLAKHIHVQCDQIIGLVGITGCYLKWNQFAEAPTDRRLIVEDRHDLGIAVESVNAFHVHHEFWKQLQELAPHLTRAHFDHLQAKSVGAMLVTLNGDKDWKTLIGSRWGNTGMVQVKTFIQFLQRGGFDVVQRTMG